uniref:ShKT domain-containing protein n=1 Tax=Panagrellus redivivus TaxID=6233 RepID=A0A7E4VCA6_PANRE
MTTLDSTRATRNPPTYGTDKTTHDATKTTDSININTTPVTQQTAKISDFTGSNTVTELTTSKPTERVVPDPTGITTTRNGSSIDGLTTTTPLPPTSGPNVECPNLFIYDDALKQCVVDGNIPNHELTETECKAAGGHINGTKCVTEVVKPTSSQPSCTDITDPACLPPPFEMTTLTPITTVETTSSTRTDEPETTTAMDFTTPKSTEHTTTSDIAGLSGGTTRTLTSGSTGVTKNESSSDGRTTTTPQPSTSGPEKTTYDPLKMTDSNVTADTIAPSMTKTTGGTASEIVTTNNITPEPTGVTKNGSSSDSSTTTTTQPPTAGTDKTTIKPPTTLNVTGSETVTTTPPETSPSLNSTSNGTSATSIPYSTGATSFTTQNIPTSTNPATLNASMPSTLTRNLTNQNFDFNISHNCPIGFMITSHFCIGVWTPDCETKHNGYKYEEACFIRFDDSGSNVGKREIACDNLGATVKSNGANVTELSTSTALETTTTATTTTTTTTTIKPPPSPPQCRNIWTSCWKQRELCGDPTWFLRMINNCAVTCGYCHCQKNLINCRINHQYDRPPPPLPPRPAPYCRDIGSNCEKRLCNISKGYHDLYFINCKRTCGYC